MKNDHNVETLKDLLAYSFEQVYSNEEITIVEFMDQLKENLRKII